MTVVELMMKRWLNCSRTKLLAGMVTLGRVILMVYATLLVRVVRSLMVKLLVK